ncbi:MAG: hypothetical protein KZQ86_12765 [Candidatus Thiodiazotropha sp. (ex Lucinoma kastoroae)]|nr:hypothetical protein [Candidatus Thiodiazotropha sp. (ex Lucinoma kastoroae)]
MFYISFDFDEVVENPDEYTMGYMIIENDGEILNSKDMLGRGMMMVFFSLVSLLESIVQLSQLNAKEYEFVGEDSSFILIFKKTDQGSINIFKDKSSFCTVSFNDFVNAVWDVSEVLYKEYGDLIDSNNIAKKDWLSAREEASPLIK